MSRRLQAVLSSDVGLTVLLVSLCVVLFVVYPFVHLGGFGRLLVTLGLTAILISLGARHNIVGIDDFSAKMRADAGPLIRMMPTPPAPRAVATAAMVSPLGFMAGSSSAQARGRTAQA